MGLNATRHYHKGAPKRKNKNIRNTLGGARLINKEGTASGFQTKTQPATCIFNINNQHHLQGHE
ncbi:hypothetical protein HMPREF1991_02216 [Hoylesella loescheii DSM 19665 = JCM 12249 = ATCC 15930]|uniref:Uncharacterized protein n=1 Tax=Hoylesella loescheii DSM 19665 = JCM 12249 = ATCC 15930 TaxID=1122985 RepID=A0A069QFS1_HOYLO|nr:hypothetical protein HMPREF1991_02216 [Hoylesella loescheii DSM 19665 = JCM 12249 = ATCC 15930]